MFHLPIHMVQNTKQNHLLWSSTRESRGYTYSILKYQMVVEPESRDDPPKLEGYSVLADVHHSKIFAYMAPRQTAAFSVVYSRDSQSSVEVRESIEGTMITFFWNEETQEWNICSRNGVGCDYSYERPLMITDERPKTFRQMVVDVFDNMTMANKNDNDSLVVIDDLRDVASLNRLSKSHCYTCILQHPDNHIVYSGLTICKLHLIAIYELNAMPPLIPVDSEDFVDGCVRELANPKRMQEYLMESKTDEDHGIWETAFSVFGRVHTSTEYLRTPEDVQAFNANLSERQVDSARIEAASLEYESESKYFPPAWILTNTVTGNTCEIVNPFYQKAKQLRNFQPNTRFQFLYLRQTRLVEEYLHTFPQYAETFQILETEYNDFITEVYDAYVKFYLMNIRDGSIPKNRFVHAARIHHRVYLKQPYFPKIKITRDDVECYFAAFEPTKMFYYITTS